MYIGNLVGLTNLESRNPNRAEAHRQRVRLYTPDSQALARLAIGTCVTIASLLAVPDAVALLPNAATPIGWLLQVIGIWLSAAILWFVAFLGILHVVSFIVRGVAVSDEGVRLWRFARVIPIKKVDALAIESQNFFSWAFSIKPVAKRLTLFECKKSWRNPGVLNLVPHYLPSFFFEPEVFSNLCADITATTFGIEPDAIDGVFAQTATFTRLKSQYATMWWQRVLVTCLIAVGLTVFLSRKAIVHYEYNDGNKAMHANNFARAKQLYSTAVMIDPAFAHGWNNLANAEFELGEFSPSKKHWEKALFFKPDFVEAKVSLAYLCLQQRDFNTAKDLIDGALMITPQNSYALVNKADFELRTGHTAEAALEAHRVLLGNGAHAPKFTAACILAQTLLLNGKYEEAENVLAKLAPIIDPTVNTGENITFALIVKSQLKRLEGKVDDARQNIQWAEKRAPSNVDVLLEK